MKPDPGGILLHNLLERAAVARAESSALVARNRQATADLDRTMDRIRARRTETDTRMPSRDLERGSS